MNRVPRDGEDEPLLTRHNIGRGNRPRRKMSKKCFTCCMITMLIIMVLCAAIAGALAGSYSFINKQVNKIVEEQVALINGSQGTENWAKPGAPVYMKFYMFNITNPTEFLNGSIPNIEEIGPFVYNENKTKYGLQWNSEETILSYNESTSYTLNKNRTRIDPSTTYINTINLPLIGLLIQLEKLSAKIKTLPSFLQEEALELLQLLTDTIQSTFHENLIMNRSVEEILWGYQDPLLKFIADMNISLLDGVLPRDGFFQLEKQHSIAFPNMVFTGKGASRLTARYIMYNGETSITKWGTPFAGMINGTEAILFHPGVKKTDVLEGYVDELFRSGYFTFKEEHVEYGIKMYRFVLPKEELNASLQDRGFHMNGPDGVLNLTAVFPLNVPIFVSKPHFLDADDFYINKVSGLSKPDRSKHDSYLCVEPITGGVLDAAKRLQINLELKEFANFSALRKLPPLTYLPLLWAAEEGKLNSTLADEFKDKVYKPLNIVHYSVISVAALSGTVSVFLLLFIVVLLLCKCETWIKEKRQGISVQFDD